jgi:putative pyruvate formate lyase activating enzyme
MESCDLCPRKCGVNRMAGRKGICSSDHTLRAASAEISLAEERVTVGTRGTGSIFMSNCNLLCVFCQNWQINHRGDGVEVTHEQLADVMIALQQRGVHNIGIVTPTHAVPHLVTALRLAIDKGLNIPFLYNTGGYDSLEVIQLLDGIADMYIPDFKFQDCETAAPFIQNAPDYTLHAAAAIKEMHRQVGECEIVDGVMNTGMIIRHLVLPENLGGADRLVRWIVDELGADTHVNIMAQYRPEFRARYHPPLDRRITPQEFEQAMRWAREAGLRNFH